MLTMLVVPFNLKSRVGVLVVCLIEAVEVRRKPLRRNVPSDETCEAGKCKYSCRTGISGH